MVYLMCVTCVHVLILVNILRIWYTLAHLGVAELLASGGAESEEQKLKVSASEEAT